MLSKKKRPKMERVKESPKLHEPVMVVEVLEAFDFGKNARLKSKGLSESNMVHVIDATLGFAGHTKKLVERGINVLGIEADTKTLEVAKDLLEEEFVQERKTSEVACPGRYKDVAPSSPNRKVKGSFTLVSGNFRNIENIALKYGLNKVDGVLYDLGFSNAQLTSNTRGFSFQDLDAPLDMRIDRVGQNVKASDLLTVLDKVQLIELFSVVLGYKESRALSSAIIKTRSIKGIKKVGDFVEIIRSVGKGKKKINIATLPFLALRIAVNSEIENLKESLQQALRQLKSGGRLVVISFHSGEDKVVKEFFLESAALDKCAVITRKPILPSKEEIKANPRSRSAKMRILTKI